MAHPFPPLDFVPGTVLGDQVYDQIGTAIVQGHLAPGERVRDIDVAKQLGVSRTPVREALQRLERFGLVEIAVGRYTRVTVPSEQLQRDTTEFVDEFVCCALRLAACRSSDDEWGTVLAAADRLIEAAEHGGFALVDASALFLTRVVRATQNAVFIRVLRESAFALQHNLRNWEACIEDPAERVAVYREVRELLAARDAYAASRALRSILVGAEPVPR